MEFDKTIKSLRILMASFQLVSSVIGIVIAIKTLLELGAEECGEPCTDEEALEEV